MSIFILDKEISFPPVHLAEKDGLLAIGGDLSPARLIHAYRHGIFPWYEGEHILWWCPNPRFVLFPDEFKIARSLKPLLNKQPFRFTINTAFEQVIANCRNIPREGQTGTWITAEVKEAYHNLHKLGYAHSAELWENDQLIGGLYGIRLGEVFFGESMFSKISQASRYTFTKYIEVLKAEGVKLIDCQVYTPYLESMGARMIPGEEFDNLLQNLVDR